jgi:hypothetical protein
MRNTLSAYPPFVKAVHFKSCIYSDSKLATHGYPFTTQDESRKFPHLEVPICEDSGHRSQKRARIMPTH